MLQSDIERMNKDHAAEVADFKSQIIEYEEKLKQIVIYSYKKMAEKAGHVEMDLDELVEESLNEVGKPFNGLSENKGSTLRD